MCTGIVIPEGILVLVEIERGGVGDDQTVVTAGQHVVHERLLRRQSQSILGSERSAGWRRSGPHRDLTESTEGDVSKDRG